MRSHAVAADRANHLCKKGWHDMDNKEPRPHGSVTSQRATGSEELFQGASNPPDINNQDYEQVPIDQRIKEIQELVKKGDKAKDKAEQYYTAAGIHLKTLKKKAPNQAAWEQLIKSRCGLSTSRAYELIQIADGRKTVAELRLGTAARMRKHRSRPSRDGQNKAAERAATTAKVGAEPKVQWPTDPFDDEHADSKTPQDFWQCSLANMAGDAISLEAFWTRQHGEAWRSYPVPSHLVTLAEQAADAWRELARSLKARSAEAAPSAPATTDDYPDMPDFLRRTPKKAAAS